MREAHFDAADIVEPLDLIRAEMCIQRAQVILQLLKLARAQEDGCHCRLAEEPGKRHLRRRLLNFAGHLLYRVYDLPVSFGEFAQSLQGIFSGTLKPGRSRLGEEVFCGVLAG